MQTLKTPVTPWFPSHAKPVREGVYQKDNAALPDKIYFAYWDGKYWGRLAANPNDARANQHRISMYQNLRWRGIIKDKT